MNVNDKALSQEPCDDAISREFIEITTHYPPSETCIYPEYKGKPYYSIKYCENGKTIIGYGTYKPEVLSRYLKEYFISSVTQKSGKWIRVTDKTGHLVWECDKCSWQQRFNTNFCPDCGAKMVEPQESENKDL